ncbi:MAG: YlxR family protein [Acidimicrobiales bacterium]
MPPTQPRAVRVQKALAKPPPGSRPPHGGPRRTCIGCRTVRPATELVRVTASAEGELVPGVLRPGRGAWLCKTSLPDCAVRALERGRWPSALRRPVSQEQAARLIELVGSEAQLSLAAQLPSRAP